jgi:hypothetical protein
MCIMTREQMCGFVQQKSLNPEGVCELGAEENICTEER